MDAIAFARFRKNPLQYIDQAIDGEALRVTRADGKDFVIVSAEEWASIQETLHVTRSPENVKRLREAHEEIEADIARRRKRA